METTRSAAVAGARIGWPGAATTIGCALRCDIRSSGSARPCITYLPEAARLLETQAVIPPHADVANAIGAITSQVSVQMKLEISPGEDGR